MKTIKLFITLFLSLAGMHATYAMENPQKKARIPHQQSIFPDKQWQGLFKHARTIMEKHDHQKATFEKKQLNYLKNLSKESSTQNIDIDLLRDQRDQMIEKIEDKERAKKIKRPAHLIIKPIKINQNNASAPIVYTAMERETINSISAIQIENRSQLLEQSEQASISEIQNQAEINELSTSESNPLNTSNVELEDFTNPYLPNSNVHQISHESGQQTNGNNHVAISADIQNQLPSHEQIVKIATLLNETLKQQKTQQPILVQKKEPTQNEIIDLTRKKIDDFTQIIDTTYVNIFDKFISSSTQLPEPRTSSLAQFYWNKWLAVIPVQDNFDIIKFTDENETKIESLLLEINSNLNKITDNNQRNQLKQYFKQNKEKWSMNAYYTEKTLNALMHDNKHKTSQDLDNITIKNGENRSQVTPGLFHKITALSDQCTNNMQIFGNTIYDKSNLAFEKKYRIEHDKAKKYNLPQLIKTANHISSNINTWMTRF